MRHNLPFMNLCVKTRAKIKIKENLKMPESLIKATCGRPFTYDLRKGALAKPERRNKMHN